jgi:hypothetical protein
MKWIVLLCLLSLIPGLIGCDRKKETSSTNPSASNSNTGQVIHVGTPVVIKDSSPSTDYAVVFEDDGETGYFYGLDTRIPSDPILDALHIYNVDNISDRDIPSTAKIIWSNDGLKSVLLINAYPHAIFNFETKRGYCRTGFPTSKRWSKEGHEWNEQALEFFK